MSREIKFRAWDKEANKMYDSNSIAVAPNNGRFSEWCISGDGITVRVDSERFILMQFTGLKDKNGKEIYEEDIIKLSENRYGGKESPISCVVKWNDRGFYQLWRNGIIHWKIWKEDSYGNAGYRKNWEIIGNIHQNPELLEDKK